MANASVGALSFTLDEDFLRKEYPVMEEFALFFVDFLIKDKEGYLVTCPSVSPENRFVLEDGSDTPICAGLPWIIRSSED